MRTLFSCPKRFTFAVPLPGPSPLSGVPMAIGEVMMYWLCHAWWSYIRLELPGGTRCRELEICCVSTCAASCSAWALASARSGWQRCGYRTTLWLHASTIQWIADTGEPYPPELRDEIQPRLNKLRPPQTAKPKQPPQPPKPMRWQERADRPKAKAEMPASQGSTLQDPQASTPSPQQLAEQDKRYMELQAVIASMGQRTLAESRPKASQPGQELNQTPVQLAPQQVDAGAHSQSGTVDNGTAKDSTTHNSSQSQATKVSAHTLAEARPEPPPSPPSTKEPKEDAPGTGRAIRAWPGSHIQVQRN